MSAESGNLIPLAYMNMSGNTDQGATGADVEVTLAFQVNDQMFENDILVKNSNTSFGVLRDCVLRVSYQVSVFCSGGIDNIGTGVFGLKNGAEIPHSFSSENARGEDDESAACTGIFLIDMAVGDTLEINMINRETNTVTSQGTMPDVGLNTLRGRSVVIEAVRLL